MIFSSIEFLLCFLPAFLILYGLAPAKMKNVVLLTGSLIFYAIGEPRYLLLLMVSVLVNYVLGLHLEQRGKRKDKKKGQKIKTQRGSRSERKRRLLLVLTVVGNISVLAVFKGGLGEKGLPLGDRKSVV